MSQMAPEAQARQDLQKIGVDDKHVTELLIRFDTDIVQTLLFAIDLSAICKGTEKAWTMTYQLLEVGGTPQEMHANVVRFVTRLGGTVSTVPPADKIERRLQQVLDLLEYRLELIHQILRHFMELDNERRIDQSPDPDGLRAQMRAMMPTTYKY